MAESTGSLRPVPAIDKAARVLRALAEGGRPQGISELARALGVSKGTLRDVLLTLDAYGLVVRDPDTRFRLGPELRALADASTPDLRAIAQPYLASLMEQFGETAILGVVHEGRLEIAARAEPATDLHMTAPRGRRLPPEEGAHGKVIPKGDAIGYDDEEPLHGVRAAAAPVVDPRGRGAEPLLPHPAAAGRACGDHDRGRARERPSAAPAADRVRRRGRGAVRLLHAGDPAVGEGASRREPAANARRDRAGDQRQPLPLHRLHRDLRGDRESGGDERESCPACLSSASSGGGCRR